ncbi:SDR family NAD(P)-dependent oxidoreductase [Ruminococcus sp. 5_1_39BFAA]|uniref:SDR family NAD(P)-dependent oxidoreductase n=1 Tax=Ruminococcus sp. 5_1_39BFAA TaxID=457412 RepID=UPI0035639CC2
MSLSTYLKRLTNYVFHGIPNNIVKVEVKSVVNGSTLTGRTILITGGNKGIGLAIGERCVQEGANVILIGRNEDDLKAASLKLGEHCSYIKYDLSNIEGLEKLLENAQQVYGEIDSLVCSAGISLHEKNICDVSIENFEKQFKTNLEGAYFLAQVFIKKNSDRDKNILFISSERGFQCDDVPYGLTKVALNSLTKGLSRRFYKDGIRVNAIAPGVTATAMTGKSSNDNMANSGQVSKRWFVPEEIAEVALFLLSDASKCISGEIIACDAGQYISSYF